MVLKAAIQLPGVPNTGIGNLAIGDVHGIQLVAFGSGKCVMILNRENMDIIHVTENFSGMVGAVSWSGNVRSMDRSSNVVRRPASCEHERFLIREGTLAAAIDASVLVLVPQHEGVVFNQATPLSWSWIPTHCLDCSFVTHLAWCPVSNILVTSSSTTISGWGIEMPISSKFGGNDHSGGDTSLINLLSAPLWHTIRAESLQGNIDAELSSKLSFTSDGVS